MNVLIASLGWRDSLLLLFGLLILVCAIIVSIDHRLARRKALRRRHRLDRLNRTGFFRDVTHKYYRSFR